MGERVAAHNKAEGMRVARMFFLAPFALPTAMRLGREEGLEGLLATMVIGVASMYGFEEQFHAWPYLFVTNAFSLGYEAGRMIRMYTQVRKE